MRPALMFHTDAVQGVGKVPSELEGYQDRHALRCPATNCMRQKASASLYLKRGTRFRPLLRGGHQERGRRAGTENSTSIVGLGKAAEMALEADGLREH